MTEKRWTNQYINRIEEKRDRIFATATPEQLASTRLQLETLRTGYDEIVCELGSGSGGHILEHAQKSPKTLFIGFELRYKRIFRTIEKAERSGIKNVYMVQGDARTILELFKSSEISGIYINFPDPWDKKRWLKHRLISSEFLAPLIERLRIGGFFSHKTDHPDYFSCTIDSVRQIETLKVTHLTNDLHKNPFAEQLVKSEFECLFISKGMPVHYLHAKKIEKTLV